MSARLQPPRVRRPDWLQRNWKWFVPALVLTILLMVGLMLGAIWFLVTGLVTRSGAYQQALEFVQQDARAQQRLGTPITRRGWFITGSINVHAGGSGYARLAIPVEGPNGRGTLHVEARKRGGRWKLIDVVLRLKPGGERLQLLGDGAEGSAVSARAEPPATTSPRRGGVVRAGPCRTPRRGPDRIRGPAW